MKQLFDLHDKLAWDDEIPSHMVDWWIDVMTEAIKAEHLCLPGAEERKSDCGGLVCLWEFVLLLLQD